MPINEEILAHFAEIKPTEILEEKILAFDSESEFVGVCVDLLIEAGSYLITAASIYPSGQDGWTRNEAIIGGSLVRLYKLIDAILDQTCKHRLETAFILSRLHFETTVNSIFLMRNPEQANFDNFVAYSLQHEGKLLDTIDKNVAERDGNSLPIEDRMRRSIERTFRMSQLEKKDLPANRMRDWQNSSLYKRAKAIGFGQAYDAVFGGGSQIVHGNWGDLYQHHLEPKGDRFVAKTSFKIPRPQFLEVNAIHSVAAVSEFICFLGLYQERPVLVDLFNSFIERVKTLSGFHENFLVQNS
ncbi:MULTISPECIES: DUF5677 domain-containing protein [unclassified Ruegeria]|uniref:DUF5677 domain-containing protein n=1 Tax=unclassified Ruegeria TaxID=2625375 RepID=UPI001AE16D83|nr:MULTISPECIES: DUF5677 domain-containing protein [unclassified Ruegeria]